MNIKDFFSSKKSKVDDPDDYVPLFDGSDDDPSQHIVVESWGSILFSWFKGGLMLALGAALFLGLLYSFLAAFLIMWVPVGSDADYLDRANVVRNTWSKTGSVPEIGDKAIISLTEMKTDTSWIDYAIYGWTRIPASAEVEVLSSDRAKLYIEPVTSDQKDEEGNNVMTGRVVILSDEAQPSFSNFTGSKVYNFDPNEAPAKQNLLLDGELLVKCVVGDCAPDSVFLISVDQIFGERNQK